MKHNDLKLIIKRPNGTTRVASIPRGKTRTQQQFKDQVNVNNIMKKYKQTGTITHVRNGQSGVYTDLTNIDYQQAADAVLKAQSAFEQIPSDVRQRFNHNPQELIEFLKNPENDQEAIKLKLKNPPKPKPEPDPLLTEMQNLTQEIKKQNTKKAREPNQYE